MAGSPIEADLEEGLHLERRLRWEDAEAVYARALATLAQRPHPDGRQHTALLLSRRGNVLMELGRWEDARRALDAAMFAAQESGDSSTIAEVLLAAGVFAATREDSSRSETFLLAALERYHRADDPESLRGRGRAFLSLATLYGKTGRLDLAFVTFTRAQDLLGAAQDWAGVAAAWENQASLRRSLGDDDRWKEDLAESVIFYDRAGMTEKAERLRKLLGRKLV